MNILQSITSKINILLFKEDITKGSFIAFFRIGTSFFILVHLLSIILDFTKLFGKQGIIPYDIREFLLSDEMLSFTQVITFFEGYGVTENFITISFLSVFIFFLLTLLFGLFTRFSAVITLLFYKAIYTGTYIYGIDGFIVTSLFYLTIFPSGYFHSIDNLIFKKRKRNNLNVTLFKRLLQINVCLVYFFAGISKAIGTTWWNGEAIWKSIHLWSANSIFNIDYSFLVAHSYLLVIIGWGVLAIETLYPIFIWIPKTRKIWLYSTLAMHIGIGVLLDLYFFAAFMMFWNITVFYINKPMPELNISKHFRFLKQEKTSQETLLEG